MKIHKKEIFKSIYFKLFEKKKTNKTALLKLS